MLIIRGCMAAVMALALGAWAERARADEAFVCEDGRVVNVRRGELEVMKRKEPCIMRYFDVDTATPVKAAIAVARQSNVAAPVVKPAAPEAVAPEPTRDYRNVRIINAGAGSAGWFRPGRQ